MEAYNMRTRRKQMINMNKAYILKLNLTPINSSKKRTLYFIQEDLPSGVKLSRAITREQARGLSNDINIATVEKTKKAKKHPRQRCRKGVDSKGNTYKRVYNPSSGRCKRATKKSSPKKSSPGKRPVRRAGETQNDFAKRCSKAGYVFDTKTKRCRMRKKRRVNKKKDGSPFI